MSRLVETPGLLQPDETKDLIAGLKPWLRMCIQDIEGTESNANRLTVAVAEHTDGIRCVCNRPSRRDDLNQILTRLFPSSGTGDRPVRVLDRDGGVAVFIRYGPTETSTFRRVTGRRSAYDRANSRLLRNVLIVVVLLGLWVGHVYTVGYVMRQGTHVPDMNQFQWLVFRYYSLFSQRVQDALLTLPGLYILSG